MKNWPWIVLAALTALTIIGQFMEHHYWWEAVPGFFAAFGFIGCLLIIFCAKFLGSLMVSQKPDYYKNSNPKEEVNPNAH